MNKNQTPKASLDRLSFEHNKIIKMCETYGLNQEETNQLLAELRIGAGSVEAESTNDTPINYEPKLASILSARNQQLSFNDSEFKFQSEYSFKPLGRQGITSQQQSFEKALIRRTKDDHQERLQELHVENQILRKENIDLQNKVNTLLQMKSQESEIILGLKNAVCTLTSLLKDKEQNYAELQQNYKRLNNLLLEKLNTQKGLQKTQKDVFHRMDYKHSRQNILMESQANSNFQRKQSKQLSKTRSSQNISQKCGDVRGSVKWCDPPQVDSKELREKGSMKKQNKLDMSKYKVFIDELKNICNNKPQRA